MKRYLNKEVLFTLKTDDYEIIHNNIITRISPSGTWLYMGSKNPEHDAGGWINKEIIQIKEVMPTPCSVCNGRDMRSLCSSVCITCNGTGIMDKGEVISL
jgi:hypothetical protein